MPAKKDDELYKNFERWFRVSKSIPTSPYLPPLYFHNSPPDFSAMDDEQKRKALEEINTYLSTLKENSLGYNKFNHIKNKILSVLPAETPKGFDTVAKKIEPEPTARKHDEIYEKFEDWLHHSRGDDWFTLKDPDFSAMDDEQIRKAIELINSHLPEWSDSSVQRLHLNQIKNKLLKLEAAKPNRNFRTRVEVQQPEGVDARAALLHHTYDRMLEENLRPHTEFRGERVAPLSDAELLAQSAANDYAMGRGSAAKEVRNREKTADEILRRSASQPAIPSDARRLLENSTQSFDPKVVAKDARAIAEEIMDSISSRAYKRYDFEKNERSENTEKEIIRRISRGKAWDSGQRDYRRKQMTREDLLRQELAESLQDTEKNTYIQALQNLQNIDAATRQRNLQAGTAGISAHQEANRASQNAANSMGHRGNEINLRNLSMLRLRADTGREQRAHAQNLINDQQQRYHEAQAHNTKQVNTLSNFVHGQPLNFVSPYVTPAVKEDAPSSGVGQLIGLTATGLGLYDKFRGKDKKGAEE